MYPETQSVYHFTALSAIGPNAFSLICGQSFSGKNKVIAIYYFSFRSSVVTSLDASNSCLYCSYVAELKLGRSIIITITLSTGAVHTNQLSLLGCK